MAEERSNRVRGKRQRVVEKELREAVADRRRLFLVHCRRDCPLRLSARLAWSYLLLRLARGRGATRHAIHRATGLGRKAAAASARELVRLGLAEADGRGRLCAVRPGEDKEEWFVGRRKARGPWHSRFAYLVLPIPDRACPLTPAQNAVLWCVVDQLACGRQVNVRGLARLVGCDRRTVSEALGRLAGLHLLGVARQTGRSRTEVTLLPPPVGFADWYRPRQSPLPSAQETPRLKDTGPRLEPGLESWVAGLAIRNFGDKDRARVRCKLAELAHAEMEPLPHQLDPILEDAERVHATSGKAACCVNLLLYKIDRWAVGQVAGAGAVAGQLDPVHSQVARQEAAEREALEPLAPFGPCRKLPCPDCGSTDALMVGEQSVAEDSLSPAGRAVLDGVRQVLHRADNVWPLRCRLRCRCRSGFVQTGYLEVDLLSPRVRRLILLPEGWEAATPSSGGQVSPPTPPESDADREDLARFEDEFLEGLER